MGKGMPPGDIGPPWAGVAEETNSRGSSAAFCPLVMRTMTFMGVMEAMRMLLRTVSPSLKVDTIPPASASRTCSFDSMP
jgi:hypothetical protein